MADLGGSDGNGQGPDPLTVASTFVAAINAHNKWLYTSCIARDASGDEITISELPGWVNRLAGDNYIAIALPRSATRFVFDERKRCKAGVGFLEIRTSRYMNKCVRN